MSQTNSKNPWLAAAVGLCVTIGTGWVGWVHGDLATVKREIQQDREKAGERNAEDRRKLGVIEEKVRRLESDSETIQRKQDAQTDKLNELLRRVR